MFLNKNIILKEMSYPSRVNLTSQYYFLTSFLLVSAAVLWTCGPVTESHTLDLRCISVTLCPGLILQL